MSTPFENFVNLELPKRISTDADPLSVPEGMVFVSTGIGLSTVPSKLPGNGWSPLFETVAFQYLDSSTPVEVTRIAAGNVFGDEETPATLKIDIAGIFSAGDVPSYMFVNGEGSIVAKELAGGTAQNLADSLNDSYWYRPEGIKFAAEGNNTLIVNFTTVGSQQGFQLFKQTPDFEFSELDGVTDINIETTQFDKYKIVFRLKDWVGGTGTDKPEGIGMYVGYSGLVEHPLDAADVRGFQGPKGETIHLRNTIEGEEDENGYVNFDGFIQWKWTHESEWRDLVSQEEIRGPVGPEGRRVHFERDTVNYQINWWWEGLEDEKYLLAKFDDIRGDEVELRNNIVTTVDPVTGHDVVNGSIQWKWSEETEEDWKELVSWDQIRGPRGPEGRRVILERDLDNYRINWFHEGLSHNKQIAATFDDIRGANPEFRFVFVNTEDPEYDEETDGVSRLEWRLDIPGHDMEWAMLVPASTITGPKGDKGDKGESPMMRVNNNEVQWKLGNEPSWKDLFNLFYVASLIDPGMIQFSTINDFMVWKYVDEPETEWKTVVALEDITGEDGVPTEFRINGDFLEWRYINQSQWTSILDLRSLDGDHPVLRVAGEFIQWKLSKEDVNQWKNLEWLGNLKGEKGDRGDRVQIRYNEETNDLEWNWVQQPADEWFHLYETPREVELNVTAEDVFWRYKFDDRFIGERDEEEDDWQLLATLPRRIEIRTEGLEVQWRYVSHDGSEPSEWQLLNEVPREIEFRTSEGEIQWRYVFEDESAWRFLTDEPRDPVYSADDEFILWRYEGEDESANRILIPIARLQETIAHNDTLAIQGGDLSNREFYHLTEDQHSIITRIGINESGNPTWDDGIFFPADQPHNELPAIDGGKPLENIPVLDENDEPVLDENDEPLFSVSPAEYFHLTQKQHSDLNRLEWNVEDDTYKKGLQLNGEHISKHIEHNEVHSKDGGIDARRVFRYTTITIGSAGQDGAQIYNNPIEGVIGYHPETEQPIIGHMYDDYEDEYYHLTKWQHDVSKDFRLSTSNDVTRIKYYRTWSRAVTNEILYKEFPLNEYVKHNRTEGVQGGSWSQNQYYHLTQEKYNIVNRIGVNANGNPTWDNGIFFPADQPHNELPGLQGGKLEETNVIGINPETNEDIVEIIPSEFFHMDELRHSIVSRLTLNANSTVPLWDGDPIPDGAGYKGWSPLLRVEYTGPEDDHITGDEKKAVFYVYGWAGGQGDEPTATGYVTASGTLSQNIENGANIRGMRGAQGIQGIQGYVGWQPSLSIFPDGSRRVMGVRPEDWYFVSGVEAGTPEQLKAEVPPRPFDTIQYMGQAGFTGLIQEATNIRGPLPQLRGGRYFNSQVFYDGTHFDAGTSNNITMEVPSDNVEDMLVMMDGVVQHHNTYTVNQTILTFVFPIPAEVRQIQIIKFAAKGSEKQLRRVNSWVGIVNKNASLSEANITSDEDILFPFCPSTDYTVNAVSLNITEVIEEGSIIVSMYYPGLNGDAEPHARIAVSQEVPISSIGNVIINIPPCFLSSLDMVWVNIKSNATFKVKALSYMDVETTLGFIDVNYDQQATALVKTTDNLTSPLIAEYNQYDLAVTNIPAMKFRVV